MTDIFWTKEKIEYLEKYYGKLSAKVIAENLGCTRNAVIGKANRIGLGKK